MLCYQPEENKYCSNSVNDDIFNENIIDIYKNHINTVCKSEICTKYNIEYLEYLEQYHDFFKNIFMNDNRFKQIVGKMQTALDALKSKECQDGTNDIENSSKLYKTMNIKLIFMALIINIIYLF